MAHSRYADYLPSLSAAQRETLGARIDTLTGENRALCDKGNYGHLCNIFTAMALYEMHLAAGCPREEALDRTAQPMWAFVEKGAGTYRRLFGKPGMLKILGWLVPKLFAKGSGAGWRYAWHEHTASRFRFECHECIYQKIFARYGVPELGPLFCHADDINYGQIPGIRFTRNHTLCKDGQPCDFLFEKE